MKRKTVLCPVVNITGIELRSESECDILEETFTGIKAETGE